MRIAAPQPLQVSCRRAAPKRGRAPALRPPGPCPTPTGALHLRTGTGTPRAGGCHAGSRARGELPRADAVAVGARAGGESARERPLCFCVARRSVVVQRTDLRERVELEAQP